MAGDDELMAMVRRLSAMPSSDRAFVLSAFDEPEASDLARLLQQVEARSMSAVMRDLVSGCADGATPSGVTARAARAIGKAAATQSAKPSVHSGPTAPASSWARFAARALGR